MPISDLHKRTVQFARFIQAQSPGRYTITLVKEAQTVFVWQIEKENSDLTGTGLPSYNLDSSGTPSDRPPQLPPAENLG